MAGFAGHVTALPLAPLFGRLIPLPAVAPGRRPSTPIHLWIALIASLAGTVGVAAPTNATLCTNDATCAATEVCHRSAGCSEGVCVPAFTLPHFVIGMPRLTAYDADVVSALDHTGTFYQSCCDTNVTAFTGESADRADGHVFCPEEPTNFPACLFATCLCGYRNPTGTAFVVNGNYASPFGAQYLYYAGHAGWDYDYGFGVDIVASADGTLCKALEDPVNGRFGFPSAWDKFHTFYIDHGAFAGRGHASWYLHAADLAGQDTLGTPLQDLAPGACAPVSAGQLVATVGNAGTGLPHLHFEVRRYEVGQGPEGPASKVVDPYGWTGSYPDPWSDPLENPQAESQIAPLWLACGNGRIECGEQCDDGNRMPADGCDAVCSIEAGFVCEGHEPSRCFEDHPISAGKLLLKRSSSGKETFVLSSSDAAFPFPPVGSDDDPSTNGATVEVLSATGEHTKYTLPPGPGSRAGWAVKTGTVASYRYRNGDAPGGPTPVRLLRLKEGKNFKVVSRRVGLALLEAQDSVAIRISNGKNRVCALFGPGNSLILRDETGRFQAKNASTSAIADCTAASLGMP